MNQRCGKFLYIKNLYKTDIYYSKCANNLVQDREKERDKKKQSEIGSGPLFFPKGRFKTIQNGWWCERKNKGCGVKIPSLAAVEAPLTAAINLNS